MIERAPAKANLALQVGEPRDDGRHALCSLFAALELADEVVLEEGAGGDTVVCAGVEGENLAARAVAALRTAVPGIELAPLRITIRKRIPVAAGLGGGSADAAAVLRGANAMAGSPLDADGLRGLAAGLGSDVPSQVDPRHALVGGGGERIEPLSLPPIALLLVPQPHGLSTADVYRRLDELRAAGEAPRRHRFDEDALRGLAAAPLPELAAGLENDLEAASVSLRPELAQALADVRAAGALGARVTGSGPTVYGVFGDRASAEAAGARIDGSLVTEAAR